MKKKSKDSCSLGDTKEIIRLKDVTKHYGFGHSLVKAVEGINVSVRKGEFVAIMGPSGSGKSTSMNLVGNLDLPSYGRIFLDGKNTSEFSESELAQLRGKKIGFIFQQFNLIPNLTALENVMLPMMYQGVNEFDRRKKALELLKTLELGKRIDHYPSQLSGGEQQRVAIARALSNDPEVILADEPTGNLDSRTGEIVLKYLNKLNDEGKTIVMITHDAGLAKRHADIVFWLSDGKLVKVTKKCGEEWRNLPLKEATLRNHNRR
jgi:putative ABC transport system ATP-binding protein